MDRIKVKDGTEIFYKDWGTGQPIVFHHGWPLSADDWDAQMMFFLGHGYRVIAHDRRGHGRSTQTVNGNDIDTYAADVAELVAKLDLKNAVHIGHSTGGGEVICYVARHGNGRVEKAVIISAIPLDCSSRREIRMEFPWRCSIASVTARPIIAPSFTKTSPFRSTDSIGPVQRYRKE